MNAPRNRQEGFTLLEAIVAMVIAAGVSAALFGWINTTLISLARTQQVTQKSELLIQAVNYLEILNPAEQRSGSVDFVYGTMNWNAFPIEDTVDALNPVTGAISEFEVGLYRVELELILPDGETWRTEVVDDGFKRVRIIDLGLGP